MTGDVAESHISQHGLVSLGARNEIDNACPAYEEDREKSITFQLIILIIIQINMNSNRRQFFKKSGLGLTALATAPLFRSEAHTSELQSRGHLVCRLLLEKKN